MLFHIQELKPFDCCAIILRHKVLRVQPQTEDHVSSLRELLQSWNGAVSEYIKTNDGVPGGPFVPC